MNFDISPQDEAEYMEYHIMLNEKMKKASLAEKLRRKRTLNTALAITQRLKTVEWENLTQAQYFKVNDTVKPFIRQYEYQLEEAKLYPERFIDNLYSFYTKMARNIQTEGKLELFMEFFHIWDEWVVAITDEPINTSVDCSYVDILLQQFEYLNDANDDLNELICGLTTEGRIITCQDLFSRVDIPNYVLSEKAAIKKNGIYVVNHNAHDNWLKATIKEYAKQGYKVSDANEIMVLQTTAQCWTNNVLSMAYFINEFTIDMLVKQPFYYTPYFKLPRQWKPTDFYKEALLHRRYLLPSNGVYAEYENARDIRSIKFKEVIRNDTVYMLYLATTSHGQISGYYNTKEGVFYSFFTRSSEAEIGKELENFILENYYRLTVKDIDFSKKKLSCMLVVNDAKEAERIGYTQNQPIVKFFFQNGKQRNYLDGYLKRGPVSVSGLIFNQQEKVSKKHYRSYNRDDYCKEAVVKSINGFVRSLPIGQQPSVENAQYAAMLGIELEPGETFVRPFMKVVSKIKERT